MTALLLSLLVAQVDPPAPLLPPPAVIRRMTVDDCVKEALKESGLVREASGKVTEWKGKLLEVESVYWPKLQGLTFVAPIFGLKFNDARNEFEADWHPKAWGPYFKLQLILAQPIYTFGRQPAGEEAASNRMLVEQARYEQTRNLVALEVRRYYLLHLYAKSMLPALNQAKSILDEAQTSAKQMYDEGTGSVTAVDLAKLKFGETVLARGMVQANIGQALALAALKHTMGMAQNVQIELVEEALPPLPEEPLPPLEEFIAKAATDRPEVKQLKFGEIAAKAFARSEELSSNPTAFIAGQLDLNYTPTWHVPSDPFAWNRFNNVTPGIAIGLQFDVDPRRTWARHEGAQGLVEQVEGLKKFASTGIPMEVRQAWDNASQADQMTKLASDGSAAGRKWLVFAGSAYAAGTGEASDILEGLVVYLQSRQAYFENLQLSHFGRANLLYVTGRTGIEEQTEPAKQTAAEE